MQQATKVYHTAQGTTVNVVWKPTMENKFKSICAYVWLNHTQNKRILLLKISDAYLLASFSKCPMDI